MSNTMSFVGRVGRDGEVRYISSNAAVLSVTVAHDVGFGDKKQTLWIEVTVWGKKAESKLVDYLKKGQQVFVSGTLSQSIYKTNDGTEKTKLVLNANILDLVGGKQDSGQQAANTTVQQNKPMPSSAQPDDEDFDVPF